jgi:heptosyltransferase-1
VLTRARRARAARGPRSGLAWARAREPLGWLYDRTFSVSWTMHAVERNRELVARALGYERTAEVQYGVDARRDVHSASNDYAVLMHSTSARAKLWREDDWLACADWLAKRGTRVVLPWGSADECARSERLAGRMSHATVPALLSLREAAALLAGAQLVIGLDTGFTHLAGALGVPTVGVYVSTDPRATGLYGCRRALNTGSARGAPPAGEVIAAADLLLAAA